MTGVSPRPAMPSTGEVPRPAGAAVSGTSHDRHVGARLSVIPDVLPDRSTGRLAGRLGRFRANGQRAHAVEREFHITCREPARGDAGCAPARGPEHLVPQPIGPSRQEVGPGAGAFGPAGEAVAPFGPRSRWGGQGKGGRRSARILGRAGLPGAIARPLQPHERPFGAGAQSNGSLIFAQHNDADDADPRPPDVAMAGRRSGAGSDRRLLAGGATRQCATGRARSMGSPAGPTRSGPRPAGPRVITSTLRPDQEVWIRWPPTCGAFPMPWINTGIPFGVSAIVAGDRESCAVARPTWGSKVSGLGCSRNRRDGFTPRYRRIAESPVRIARGFWATPNRRRPSRAPWGALALCCGLRPRVWYCRARPPWPNAVREDLPGPLGGD